MLFSIDEYDDEDINEEEREGVRIKEEKVKEEEMKSFMDTEMPVKIKRFGKSLCHIHQFHIAFHKHILIQTDAQLFHVRCC